MCKSCVAWYTEATFPEAEACEVCLQPDPSEGSWLYGSSKAFQRSKLVCQHMTPGCKKRSCARPVTVPATNIGGTPPRLERDDRNRKSPPPFATGELRSYSTADGTARSSKQQLFTAAPGATERCACAPCAGLNPESLMK